MSAVDDVARMLTLVPWLLERPGASVAETADAFGVSPAQIRRDLNHLDFCGLPGLGGGDLFDVTIVGDRVVVSMAEELRRPLRLTAREALRLLLTIDAVAAAFGDDLPALASALAKIRDAAGMEAGVRVGVEPEGRRWVPLLRDAIADQRQVVLDYRGRNDEQAQRRTVDPWRLHVVDGIFYLQGRDHGADDLRTFRLDRVATVEALQADSRTAAPADLPAPRYVPGPDDVEVVLRLEPGARWLSGAIDPDSVEELGEGRQLVRFHTDASRWVERLLLAAGADAEVVEPEELRDRVGSLARHALTRYERA